MSTTVKDSERSRRLRERWADPAYRAKMQAAAKRGAATTNARKRGAVIHSSAQEKSNASNSNVAPAPRDQTADAVLEVASAPLDGTAAAVAAATARPSSPAEGTRADPKAPRRAWAPWRRRASA